MLHEPCVVCGGVGSGLFARDVFVCVCWWEGRYIL